MDLRPDCSRQMTKKTFVVHCGSNLIGDVYFMEVGGCQYSYVVIINFRSFIVLEMEC